MTYEPLVGTLCGTLGSLENSREYPDGVFCPIRKEVNIHFDSILAATPGLMLARRSRRRSVDCIIYESIEGISRMYKARQKTVERQTCIFIACPWKAN